MRGRGEVFARGSLQRVVVEADSFDDFRGDLVVLEIVRADGRVVPAEQGALGGEDLGFVFVNTLGELCEFRGKYFGDDDLADVLEQAGDVVGVVVDRDVGVVEEVAGREGAGERVQPKIAPGNLGAVCAHGAHVFEDGRGQGERTDLAEAEVENSVLDCSDLGAEPEVHAVDHAQQARGERRISRDDLCELPGLRVVVAEEIGESAVDAAQGRQLGAGFDALPQLEFGYHGLGRTRQNWGWGTQAEINIIRVIRLSGEDSLSPERAQSLFGGNDARVEPADAFGCHELMARSAGARGRDFDALACRRRGHAGGVRGLGWGDWVNIFVRLFARKKCLSIRYSRIMYYYDNETTRCGHRFETVLGGVAWQLC